MVFLRYVRLSIGLQVQSILAITLLSIAVVYVAVTFDEELVPGFGDAVPFFFFFTLVTGPRRSLSLKLSDTRVYEPRDTS